MASLMKNIFYTLAETLNYNLNLRSIEQFDDILQQPIRCRFPWIRFGMEDSSLTFRLVQYPRSDKRSYPECQTVE